MACEQEQALYDSARQTSAAAVTLVNSKTDLLMSALETQASDMQNLNASNTVVNQLRGELTQAIQARDAAIMAEEQARTALENCQGGGQ